MHRFFSTAARIEGKKLINKVYQQNEKEMQRALEKIKPNPGCEKIDANGFNTAMKEAEKKDMNSYYYR
jgi:hypothetical protein